MEIVAMYSIGMARPTEAPTTGYLLWRLTTKLRAGVDRALGPLGLSHAQYTLLASLYGLSRSGAQPSQRQLADWTGLEPIFVSKLARALEQAGLLERRPDRRDARAVQLRLTADGTATAQRAIAIVAALQEEFFAPIGGPTSPHTRHLAATLQALLAAEPRSETMSSPIPVPAPALLTGQDVGEAEGALTALLNRTLAATNTGITRTEYITLRVLASRGPQPSPAALHAFLARQPQLGLDGGHVAELLGHLEARGLLSGGAIDGPGPVELTPAGAALCERLIEAVTVAARGLYADFDQDDLATAHRVLVELTQRAAHLGGQA